MERAFDSLWTLGDYVSVTFPGNGIINRCKVIKVAFNGNEPLYDVDIPFKMTSDDGTYTEIIHARLHGIREWHLRIPGELNLRTGEQPYKPESALSSVHGMIHDAAYALSQGNHEEVKRLHREMDLLTHEEIGKEQVVPV